MEQNWDKTNVIILLSGPNLFAQQPIIFSVSLRTESVISA